MYISSTYIRQLHHVYIYILYFFHLHFFYYKQRPFFSLCVWVVNARNARNARMASLASLKPIAAQNAFASFGKSLGILISLQV